MIDCSVCGSLRHTALYCPDVRIDRGAIERRLQAFVTTAPPQPRIRQIEPPPPDPFDEVRQAMSNQVGELVDGLDDFRGIEEMPAPARDLTAYADAFASARRNCGHLDVNNVQYGRMWHCLDCRQNLDRNAMRRARSDNFWWTW